MMFSKTGPKAGRVYLTELDRDEIIVKLEKRLKSYQSNTCPVDGCDCKNPDDPVAIRELRYALRLLRGTR